MHVTFLETSVHVAKTYALSDGALIKTPYPNVYEVTSHTSAVTDLKMFYKLIINHAAQGNALLKGVIQNQLTNQSRAGSTQANTPTEWICLDIDGLVPGDGSLPDSSAVEDILTKIGCDKVDYILQWSNSMGIETTDEIRCHVFILLDRPTDPRLIKTWLLNLNLELPELKSQLRLTRTGSSLRYRLDITTCQNDKLLFIAAPKLKGIRDPYPNPKKRFQLIKRQKRFLTIDLPTIPPEALRDKIQKEVNRLRTLEGIPRLPKGRYKRAGAIEYRCNIEAALITDQKEERGFMYFNLNGGDSWAYYHPIDNPEFIHNFKGEGTYRTADLLPEYWNSLQTEGRKEATQQREDDPIQRLVITDRASSALYALELEKRTGKILMETKLANDTRARDYLKLHNIPIPDAYPWWDRAWDPKRPPGAHVKDAFLNIYEPSPFELKPPDKRSRYTFPTIEKIIAHALGNDKLTVQAFINWLAVLVQYPGNNGTAWILQGISGTGKGVLFNEILRPMLGLDNCKAISVNALNEIYTPFFDRTRLLFVDEVEVDLLKGAALAKLKQAISEPVLSVRQMYQTARPIESYLNIIMASNMRAPIRITPDDRRYSIGVYQEIPISLSVNEISNIPDELGQFYGFLKYYKADRDQARHAHVNSAKAAVIKLNRLSIDEVCDALRAGDMEFFWDNLPSGPVSPTRTILQVEYRSLIRDIFLNNRTKIPREDLLTLFDWCVGGMPQSPNKFTALIKHYNLTLTQIWYNGRNVRGIDVRWMQPKSDPFWFKQRQKEAEKL